jgi:hypothetical protein
MKTLFQLAVCGVLLAGSALAQHRGGGGGGMGGGGFHASGMGGGFAHAGGAAVGGVRTGGMAVGGAAVGARGVSGYGGGVAYHGGYGYGAGAYHGGYGYGHGYGYGYGYRGYYGHYYGGYYPWWGFGFGYYPYAYGYYPYYGYYPSYGYTPSYYTDPGYSSDYYASYAPASNVNVVYPPSQPTTVYVNPGGSSYDQYGQPRASAPGYNYNSDEGSPIYLIATLDHTVETALSYRVNGSNLELVTLDHQRKSIPLDQVDRNLSLRLNRERHVSFQLPQ